MCARLRSVARVAAARARVRMHARVRQKPMTTSFNATAKGLFSEWGTGSGGLGHSEHVEGGHQRKKKVGVHKSIRELAPRVLAIF